MSIIQALVGSIVSSGSGGGGPPPAPSAYPPTLTAMDGSLLFQAGQQGHLIATTGQADWAVGTGDYTIEWQQWMLDTSNSNARVFSVGNWPSAALSLSLENGTAYLWAEGGGSSIITSFVYDTTAILNDWVHVAIVRISGTTTIYFNGVSQVVTSNSYNVTTNSNLYIGNEPALDAGFGGYIKDFRFVKGVGIYTSAFTPPEEFRAATAETVLMLYVPDSGSAFVDQTSRHGSFQWGGVNYADVGPYALTLKVDANDPASHTVDSGNWNDLSVWNHDVTVGGGSWTNNGTYTMFDFGSSAQGYDAGSSATVQNAITPRISMSFWAHIAPHTDYQHIAGFRGEDKFHIVLFPNSTYLECRVETTTGYFDLPGPMINSTINTMAHYAFVANGDRTDLYVNGALMATNTSISGFYRGTLGAFELARAAGGFQSQGLKMGYVRVDNRARGPKEILREYNATKATYGY